MREGIYRLYRLYPGEDGKVQSRLIGRFMFRGSRIAVLEDHDGVLESMSPDGQVTDRLLGQFINMKVSPYWRLVFEDDVQGGEHDEYLPTVNAGPTNRPVPE